MADHAAVDQCRDKAGSVILPTNATEDIVGSLLDIMAQKIAEFTIIIYNDVTCVNVTNDETFNGG